MARILLLLSLLVNLILGGYIWSVRTNNEYKVERVIDGDTFVVENKRTIRLMSVNAPEVELCGGKEATEKLKSLVEGKKVRLEGEINDTFGRFLALVYIDNLLINEEMIASGWGRFTSTNSSESEKLKLAFQKAKDEKVGIFGAKCWQSTNPNNIKCNIKGNIREGKKTYFFPGCGNYSNVNIELDLGDKWFCSEKEAIENGFVKSINCHQKTY